MRLLLFLATIMIVLSACTQTPTTPPTEATATPPSADTDTDTPPAYPPAPGCNPYLDPYCTPVVVSPVPCNDELITTITEPVRVSDTTISGTGVPGLPIIIMDITADGKPLGRTTIGNDGTFSITVDADELELRHRIAIHLDDLSGTDFRQEDFFPCGEHLPFFGLVLDSTFVAEDD